MRHSSVEYLAPARFDDLLEVFVRIDRIGRSSVTYVYAAHRLELDESGALVTDALMVTATQALVLIDHGTRETLPVPERFRLRASEFEGVEFGGEAPG
jgi:acyl-CoA thioester hydrolase